VRERFVSLLGQVGGGVRDARSRQFAKKGTKYKKEEGGLRQENDVIVMGLIENSKLTGGRIKPGGARETRRAGVEVFLPVPGVCFHHYW